MSANRDPNSIDLNRTIEDSSAKQQKISAEDKPTDHWVPSSAAFIQKRSDPAKDFDEHLMELSKPLPRLGDTLIDGAPPSLPEKTPAAEVHITPAELQAAQQSSVKQADVQATSSDPEELDTVEMTSEEAAVMLAEMKARATAMDQHTLPPPQDSPLPSIGAGNTLAPVQKSGQSTSHFECRICGQTVNAPGPVHFRGPTSSSRGFHCEKCGIVLCATHAVRTSGFFTSLLSHARFSCPICLQARKTGEG